MPMNYYGILVAVATGSSPTKLCRGLLQNKAVLSTVLGIAYFVEVRLDKWRRSSLRVSAMASSIQNPRGRILMFSADSLPLIGDLAMARM